MRIDINRHEKVFERIKQIMSQEKYRGKGFEEATEMMIEELDKSEIIEMRQAFKEMDELFYAAEKRLLDAWVSVYPPIKHR